MPISPEPAHVITPPFHPQEIVLTERAKQLDMVLCRVFWNKKAAVEAAYEYKQPFYYRAGRESVWLVAVAR